MDRLTLELLAAQAPDTALEYHFPKSMVNMAPVIECARCALSYVLAHDRPFQAMSGLERYSVLAQLPKPGWTCYACGGVVRVNLDLTQ